MLKKEQAVRKLGMSSFFILARKQRYQVFSEQTNDSFAKSYLLTANPPINLYLRDSHCAIAHKPRWATFSAYSYNERKSEQAHIPHAPTLLEKAVYHEWQFQALWTGNRTKKGI